MSLRHYRIALAVIVLAAVGVRLAVIEKFVGLDEPISAADGLDQLDYELFAWRMASGEGYTLADGAPTARRTPGTSLLMLPMYAAFGRSLLAARVWFALLSAATCLVVAWLLERMCGRVTALIGAALLAMNPGSFYYTLHLWSEPGYGLFLALATMLAVVAWRKEENWVPTALLAGVCWGCALLIRPQVVFLLPFAALTVLWLPAVQRTRAVKQLVVQCLLVGAIASPWVIRNAIVMGKPCLATVVGGMTFWGAHNEVTLTDPAWRGLWVIPVQLDDDGLRDATNEIAKGDRAMALAWAALRKHPAEIPTLLVAKMYRLVTPFEPTINRAVYWCFALSWMLSAPFVALGLYELRRRDSVLFAFLAFHLGGLVLSTLLFYGAARFRHAVEPLMMVSAAVGVMACLEYIGLPFMRTLTTASLPVGTPRRASVPSAGR
ncbi:MAG TPA: glycosyltransferase family 39 protein [Planctomycetaceae bacterium]|nr:glycosyltransferase family 39 protein [Planctomycetaceae bacterium]